MTDPRSADTAHLDAATIAAFVDRTLDPAARAAAEAHLAACADCREVWVETSEMVKQEAAGAPGNEAGRAARSRSLLRVGIPLGLAAGLVLAANFLWFQRGTDIDRSVRQLLPASATHRFTQGRLSAPLRYLPPPADTRGEGDRPAPEALEAAGRLLALAETRDSIDALQAGSMALLLTGDRDEAVALLQRAVQLAPERASVRSDLAVAYLEMWRYSSEAMHLAKAVDEARRALLLDPQDAPAAFNLALALEAIGLRDEAQRAWADYLALDAVSPWAEEARRRSSGVAGEDNHSLSSLYADLETVWLPQWTASRGSTERAALARAAEALGPDGDLTLRKLTDAALDPAIEDGPRLHCLDAAIRGLAEWTRAFEAGQSDVAMTAAIDAHRGLVCLGVDPIDAESRRSVSLFELNQMEAAAAAADQVLRVEPAGAHHRARARAFQIRALVAYQRAGYSDALESALAASDEARQAHDASFHAALQTLTSNLLSTQGDVAGAWRHLALALKDLPAMTSPRRRYSILAVASVNAMELQWSGAGLAFADALIRSSEEWTNPLGRAFGYLKRAEAFGSLGRRDLVPENIARAQTLAAAVTPAAARAELEAQSHMTIGLVGDGPTGDAAPALDGALAYFQRTGNRVMQAPALLARGRLLAAAGQDEAAARDWLAGLQIIEDERPEIRDTQLLISRLDRVWELYEELIALTIGRDVRAALELSERGRGRQLLDSLSTRQQPGKPLAGPDMTSWIPSGAVALIYATLPRELIIWKADAAGVVATRRPISRGDLDVLVDRHLASLRSGIASTAAATLTEVLLPDALSLPSQLLVLADGPLHRLPFASLPGRDHTPLVQRTTIVSAPSLTLARLSSGPRTSIEPVIPLLVGNGLASPDAGLPRLPGVRGEITSIRALYDQATVLLDEEVRAARVLSAMRTHGVIHFAGHAIADAIHPRRSRLVIAGPPGQEALTAGVIADAQLLPGTVVVLAACDTANGGIFRGEGTMALSRSFVAAGAAAVVGTLWQLDDVAGSTFLVDFHKALSATSSASEALASTQRAWAAAGRTAAVWAAFHITGGLQMVQEDK